MVGTGLHTRWSAAGRSRPALVALLLCLAVLLPALPLQSVEAAPDGTSANSLRAQQPDPPLIAFLRQGNLWLMNEDGSGKRQVTDYPEGVPWYSWSPSGRYILLQHGGRFWHYTMSRDSDPPEPRLALYDVTTGDLRDLMLMPNGIPYPQGSFPSWAVDADEILMEVSEGSSTYSIVRIGLDGTATPVSSYTLQQPCAGPSGPSMITLDLLWNQELGSFFARDAYQGIVWWSDHDVAYINPECSTGVALDLVTGAMSEYPTTVWLAGNPDGRILIQDFALVGGETAGIFDPATSATTPIDAGEVFAWSPMGEIVSTTVTQGAESAFASEFDDVPSGYIDNTVDVWRAEDQGGDRQHVATLDVQGTGVPSVTADGAIIVGAVDNPTALMDVDESQYSEYSPEIYAEHQKILRIDPGGEVTVLATNAYRPRLQPAGASAAEPADPEDAPADLTGTPTVTATEVAQQPVTASGDGLIAYTSGGNIWLSRSDGSDQRQVTTDGSPERPYISPSWSHDGTMLVFSTRNAEEESGNDIYLLRDGEVTRVPAIHNCDNAAFTADNTRLLLLCSTSFGGGTVPEQQTLDTYPPYAFVSMVDLDGSNWEVLAPVQLQIDGADTLWWTMLSTHDISVSPVDGEMLVNSIFWSSARWRQIHLIDSAGEWDALFDAPPGDQGRIWGKFSADGTNILARLCRGCYKDSPGPPNTSILLLDREGNLVETLYTPDPNVTIGSFAQSPDGSRLLLRTTTEETDFDFGTAGLTYITQLVDIATGTTTEVPIDGGGFAWQPVAVDIAVPESTAGLRPATQFIGAPISAITCTTTSEGFRMSTDGVEMPEGCDWSEGAQFDITGPNGESYGICTIESRGDCSIVGVWMPTDVEVSITLNEATVPEGYTLVGGNPQKRTFPSGSINTDAVWWYLEIMPADVAAAQGDAPTGGSSEATETTTGEATEPASGPGPVIEPGRDWIAYVGEDGNIWLMQPDGSQQTQVTTDGSMEHGLPTYQTPIWSPDGTILVFHKTGSSDEGIMVYRDGTLTSVPNTARCVPAAVTLDNSRLLYSCASSGAPYETDPTVDQLSTDPRLAAVASSNLDGTDARVLVPYTFSNSGQNGIPWVDSGLVGFNGLGSLAVNSSTGEILATFGLLHGATAWIVGPGEAPTLTEIPFSDANQDRLGPFIAKFLPGSEQVVALVCEQGCYPDYDEQVRSILILNRDGSVSQRLIGTDTVPGLVDFTVSPDATTLILATYSTGGDASSMLWGMPIGQGATPLVAGSSPAWQPSGEAPEQQPESPDSGTTAEATIDPAETSTETAETGSGIRIEPESDWIAYEGDDSNIWLMQPDGSQQVQVTTDGTREAPYAWPTWSHDGTMLVFARRPSYDLGEPATIHVLRNGAVSQVPNVHGCNAAAFMPGDQELVLGCGSDFPPSGASDAAMQTDPALGFVSMVNLDGSDWHVHVPYHRASEGVWPNHEGGPDMAWVESMSVHPDGTILLSFSGPHGHGLALLEPGVTTPVMHRSPLGRGGVVGRFFPGSAEILIGACKGCYPRANSGDPEFTVAWMDRGGAITTTLYVPDPLQEMGMPTISPDGSTLVFSTNRSIQSLDLATGSQVTIGAGTAVAWQPNASVAMERPEEPVTVRSASSPSSTTTPAAPSGQPAPSTVPSAFFARWSGRGVQENPSGEWPVTISITGGEVGEIVGTSEYPEEGCGGNLILQEVTADAIVLLEQLTYGQEACADNGTITLSGIDNVAVQFAWSGIGPYGTPSTASGTLYRPDSASAAPSGGSATQPGTQDGPVIDTTQLHTFFIGTWAGTGDQLNPTNQWPITVTFTGGRPGEVVGTVEYPTLGCGGELTLDSIDPNDTFLTIYVTERITYGQDNCTDIGSFTFSGVESATRLRFSYASPNVATTAEGSLDPVEPGAASTSSSMEAVPGGDAIKHFIGTWEGTGTQSNTGATWPITFTFTNDQEGEVVGSVEYPTLGCGGELILVRNLLMPGVTSGIEVTEHITYGVDNCIDGGTFTFWLAEGGGKTGFNWVSPDGSVTARGPIDMVEPGAASAPAGEGSAAQSGTQDGPVVDTTKLDPYYIGTFSGTGKQTDPDNTWPITVTFTGGRPGEVIGTVEYPTLGCGGELILDSINPNDEWRGFRVTERITYGHDNCIDGGTFAFSSAESGIGITFGWTSPVGATRASGHLPPVEPGATTAPADQPAAASGETSGGPPSIYDDPDAEPVPIEAESD